jgi:hypothetical protein
MTIHPRDILQDYRLGSRQATVDLQKAGVPGIHIPFRVLDLINPYTEHNAAGLQTWAQQLNLKAQGYLGADDTPIFGHGPDFERVRLRSYPELIALFAGSQ